LHILQAVNNISSQPESQPASNDQNKKIGPEISAPQTFKTFFNSS
jgi:hypothetical protein